VSFFLGKEQETETLVELPVAALHRHLMAIGASGSGKTVLCKCIMEEAIRHNIPAIIVDPQGDISSLALKGDPETLESRGVSLTMQEDFFEKARIAIFTPASSKGIPISVNPLTFPSDDTPHEEAIMALDMIATSLTSFLGYDLESISVHPSGASVAKTKTHQGYGSYGRTGAKTTNGNHRNASEFCHKTGTRGDRP
jgi:type IV secretory pathway VirB4 component